VGSPKASNNHSFSPPPRLLKDWFGKFFHWLFDKSILFEAFFVALSLHVLIVPVLWVMGWALPWPSGPVITTIIEYDLSNWPKVNKPKRIFNVRYPDKNQ
jgi:hypothetical protein